MRLLTETRAGRAIVVIAFLAVVAANPRTAAVFGLIAVVEGVGTVAHELGHLLAAKAVGYRIDELRVGYGRRLWRGTIRDIPVVVRALPFTGHVRFTSATGARRWKDLTVLVGGPAANVGVALISLAALPGPWALPLVAVNGIAAIGNLIPFRSKVGPTDGLQIFQLLAGRLRHAGAWR